MNGFSERVPARLRKALRPAAPLLRAAVLWNDANGMRMSAAISFYGILSLAPLLIVVVGLLGWWIDRDALARDLVAQVGTLIGERGASLVGQALASARQPSEGLLASLAGFIVLLAGATGVFGELQAAFGRLWSGQDRPAAAAWRHAASLRLRGIGYVLAFGFLLLVSLAISTVLNLFAGWAGQRFALEQAVRVLNEVAAFGICAALFFGLMRISSGRKPRSRSLLVGAIVGATLFTAGRQVLALYLSGAAVVSAYGAAGSVVVLLMWIFFSSAVLLYGAGCAKAVDDVRRENSGRRERPRGRHLRHSLQGGVR